jgi:hypothetical protein
MKPENPLVSDRLVAVYFETMEQSYRDKPNMGATDRVRQALEQVLKEKDKHDARSGRRM